MKILEIASFNIGACGPTSVLIPIIKRLTDKGHTVDVFSPYKYEQKRETAIMELGSQYYYKNSKSPVTMKQLLLSVPELKTYDVVHIHGVFNLEHVIIARLLAQMDIPYIVSIHGNLMEQALLKSKYKKKVAIGLFIKKMLNNASTIHALAEKEQDDIKKITGNKNIKMIPNGVETGKELKELNTSTDDILRMLFIGRLDTNHKGLDLLMEAFEKQKEKWKDSIKLYLVGPFDTNADERYIRGKIDNSILLKEMVEIEGPKYGIEKDKYYNKCDLFVHTSRYEGMPMSVLEAMQVGLPSLVTPGTNMANIIEVSGGGFIVDANVDSIVNVINNIRKIPKGDLIKIGRKASEWSTKYLNWDRITKQYEEMYSETKLKTYCKKPRGVHS